jgi:hypothetical protein
VANHSSHIDTPTILRARVFNTLPVQRKGEAVVPDAARKWRG